MNIKAIYVCYIETCIKWFTLLVTLKQKLLDHHSNYQVLEELSTSWN